MLICVDVDYRAGSVVAACLGFRDWSDESPAFERARRFEAQPASYESGQFYRREMPFVLELLRSLDELAELVIVDSYVWLDGGHPGFGAHLHEALGRVCPVVGVAKRPFRGAANALPLLRGSSKVPLFVSAVGVEVNEAVADISRMHGPHRIPTLLRRVDQLSRQ